MDMATAAMLGASIAASVASISAAFGNSNVITRTLDGIARQPESRSALQTIMFIGVGIIEALPLLTWVLALLMVLTRTSL